jgi:hopanoid biosynthesis associated protein HpnK
MGKSLKRLIVNADDFGLHTLVNEGILEGHNHGCISSTSIMASGLAFDEAVAIAKATPTLGVGVHLTLVGSGHTVCSPADIPSLVNASGELMASYGQFLPIYCSGQIRLAEISRELTAQIEKVLESGLLITHFDSHQHMHVVPGIDDIVIDLARRYHISAVRIPAEPYFFIGGFPWTLPRYIGRGGLTFLANLARRKYRQAGLATTNQFYGMLAGGTMLPQYFAKIIAGLPEGSSEIMIHPGNQSQLLNVQYPWGYHWEDELEATLQPTVQDELARQQIGLISFKELPYA